MSTTRKYHMTITVEADRYDQLPRPNELRIGIAEGLPKEWFAKQHLEDFQLAEIEVDELPLKRYVLQRTEEFEVMAIDEEDAWDAVADAPNPQVLTARVVKDVLVDIKEA